MNKESNQLLQEYNDLIDDLEKTRIEYQEIQNKTEVLKKMLFEKGESPELLEEIKENFEQYKIYKEKFNNLNLKTILLKEKFNIKK